MEYMGVKRDWYTVGGKRYYFKSGGEVKVAEYLEFLKQIGEIKEWSYEPKTFKFTEIQKGTLVYHPDFLITYEEQNPEYQPPRFLDVDERYTTPAFIIKHRWWEVKFGYMTQKAVTQLRRMSIYYPEETIILVVDRIPLVRTRKGKLNVFRQKIDQASKYVERVLDLSTTDFFKGRK